jgi:hypothetical protein
MVWPDASTVDFSGFIPPLDRVVAVLKHHEARRSVSLSAAAGQQG